MKTKHLNLFVFLSIKINLIGRSEKKSCGKNLTDDRVMKF